jgi:hypothetical protein
MTCYLQLEDISGVLQLEDIGGNLLLEDCEDVGPAGGGVHHNSYLNSKFDYEERQRKLERDRKRIEQLQADKNKEIVAMETRRKERLDDQALQLKLLLLLQEQEQLRIQLEKIIQEMMDEEDTIAILLLSLPFVS